MTRLGRTLGATLVATCLLFAGAELLLRLLGYPEGTFAALFPSQAGLYPEKAVLRMTWGPIPYVVRTNSLGLRGKEIEGTKAKGTLRIVTVGDSITDGFFVDNEATWEYALEERLKTMLARPVEVVSCARGAASIDKELFILRHYALPLRPDVVVLTFVTNDIAAILGKTAAELTRDAPAGNGTGPGGSFTRWALTRTAVGEATFDVYLKLRSAPYRRKRQRVRAKRYDDSRYAIDGGNEFADNAALFLEKIHTSDGLVLGDDWDGPTTAAVAAYRDALSEFVTLCRESGASFLFVYFPAYSQIYGERPSRRINETLRAYCRDLGIEFVDLTDGFIRVGRNSVLHNAPLDYHLNPAGHRAFARLLAEELLARGGAMLRPH